MRTKNKFIGTAPYYSFGWLRRKVLDNQSGYCYEMPNGDLVYTPDSRHKYGMKLEIWTDENGERFCTLEPRRNIKAA